MKEASGDKWDPNNPYELIRIDNNAENDEIVCDICLDPEDDDGDEIVICDLCLVGVHQSCYGGKLKHRIPQGSWYCDRCEELVKDRTKKCTEIKCFLCPDIDGAIKKVNVGANKNDADLWAHVVCVNWTPEIWFTNDDNCHISGALQRDRFELRCTRCKGAKEGSCIQCDYKNCGCSFHVRCSIKMGGIEMWETMQENLGNPSETDATPVFCNAHRRDGNFKFKIKGAEAIQASGKKQGTLNANK